MPSGEAVKPYATNQGRLSAGTPASGERERLEGDSSQVADSATWAPAFLPDGRRNEGKHPLTSLMSHTALSTAFPNEDKPSENSKASSWTMMPGPLPLVDNQATMLRAVALSD
eukprot:570656-Amphidinium_carterae.2